MKRIGGLAGVLAVAVAGCVSSGEDASGTKAGSDARPTTLRLATVDVPGRPASDDVEEFARRIEALSEGSIQVEIRWEAHEAVVDELDPEPYDALAEQVLAGEVDLALVPDFTLVDRGANALRALKAPFLITSDALAAEVATGELAGELLAGVEDAGLIGLVLLPETLRHPIGFDREFRDAGDFAGATLRTFDDGAVDILRTLGADGRSANANDFFAQVAAGEIHGADSAFAQFATLPTTGAFTGNITFFARLNVLVAHDGLADRLDERQWDVLRAAAAGTLDYVVDTNPTDAQSAQDHCDQGGVVVLAADDAVAAIERAAEPVYAELERDPDVRSMIERIGDLKRGIADPPVVPACAPATGPPDETAPPDPVAFPEGVYRLDMPAEFLIDAGIDAGAADDHAGLWTLHFEDGRFLDPGCPGSTYSVTDGRVSVVLGPEGPTCGSAAGGELFSAAWELDGDALRFVDVRSGVDGPAWQLFHETLWGGLPWTKID